MEHWQKVLSVQRMQDYIATNIMRPITLVDLAKTAGYSPWHSARVFKEMTGRAPFDYIRSLRLTKAAMRLHDCGGRILDVALDFVFDTHEGFTRAFSKEFGMSPRAYAKQKPPIKFFMPIKARDYYLIRQREDCVSMKNTNTVFVQVIERPERKLMLRRGKKATHYFDYCEEVGCEVWEVLSGIKEALYEPIGMWLPQSLRPNGTSEYAQGVELSLDYNGEVPKEYEMITLPACQMMVFQGPPFDDEKFEHAIDEIWQVMKTYDPSLYGFEWADNAAPRFQLAPMGYRGYIEARPVRRISK